MKNEIKVILDTVRTLNKKKEIWSYLTSIEYMVKSKLYVDSIYYDASKVAQHISGKSYKVLDFGTGSGIFAIILRNLNKNAKICAIDTYHDKSQKDPNFKDTSSEQKLIWNEFNKVFKIDFTHYDELSIPFPDNTFDIITAYAVIEHIEPRELDKILNELKRVLKKDGLFFVFKTPRKLAYAERLAGLMRLGCHDILYGDLEVKSIFLKHHFDILSNWKSNMVFEFPGIITNLFYPILKPLDSLLYYSPFRIFAHHNNFVLRKHF
ncbi:MAG: class I SAM-dependent methyltransferase [Actinobacteria bacterium]|nr:class I SAM-dependent methyltransferase [Actinomycetota bacterium]